MKANILFKVPAVCRDHIAHCYRSAKLDPMNMHWWYDRVWGILFGLLCGDAINAYEHRALQEYYERWFATIKEV